MYVHKYVCDIKVYLRGHNFEKLTKENEFLH